MHVLLINSVTNESKFFCLSFLDVANSTKTLHCDKWVLKETPKEIISVIKIMTV